MILNLVGCLDQNDVVEEEDETWGTLVALPEKPHQENMPCNEYQWRMFVYCRKMNKVTIPFDFPTPLCNNLVQEIDPEAK